MAEADGDRITRAYAAALRVPMRLLGPSWPEVFALAGAYGLSACDASYLQVAAALHLPLATLDDVLGTAAKRLGLGAPSRPNGADEER